MKKQTQCNSVIRAELHNSDLILNNMYQTVAHVARTP